jgi:hypothetical protein
VFEADRSRQCLLGLESGVRLDRRERAAAAARFRVGWGQNSSAPGATARRETDPVMRVSAAGDSVSSTCGLIKVGWVR